MASGRRSFARVERVAATARKALAEPVSALARSAGIGLAAITAIELAPDLRRGTVYLSVYADAETQAGFVREANAQAAMLQAVLARSLRTRRVPVLEFRHDDSIARGDRIGRLLRDPPARAD